MSTSKGLVVRVGTRGVKGTLLGLVDVSADGTRWSCPCCGSDHPTGEPAPGESSGCKTYITDLPDEQAREWLDRDPIGVADVGDWDD